MAHSEPSRDAAPSFTDWIWDRSATGVPRRRRQLQIVLALLWLLDAGLQAQPYMFGTRFAKQVIEGAAPGNPNVLKQPMMSMAHLILRHPAIWNSGFATIQLLLALGLLWRPTIKAALAASVGWSLLVWWFGEGAGRVFSGTTPVMGYPGAVLFYALVALYLWPRTKTSASVATGSVLGRTAPKVIWLVLWASFVRFLLLSDNRSPQGLKTAVSSSAGGEPGWEKLIDNGLAGALSHHGTEVSVLLAVLCAFVAVAVVMPRRWLVQAGLVLSVVAALAFWVAQDFGGLFTGHGTDPNTGPLLILLAATMWPVAVSRPNMHRRREGDRHPGVGRVDVDPESPGASEGDLEVVLEVVPRAGVGQRDR